eukprot:2876808-Rhodomonas_salina.1
MGGEGKISTGSDLPMLLRIRYVMVGTDIWSTAIAVHSSAMQCTALMYIMVRWYRDATAHEGADVSHGATALRHMPVLRGCGADVQRHHTVCLSPNMNPKLGLCPSMNPKHANCTAYSGLTRTPDP